MLPHKLKKIKNEIGLYGVPAFFLFKMKEQYYKQRFKKMGIGYPEKQDPSFGPKQQSENKDGKKNQSSSYYKMKMAFTALGKDFPSLSLLDIGCGDGKVINFAMLLGFKKVIGIDLDELAVNVATDNCSKMKKYGCNVQFNVYCANAAGYIIPAGTNVIYMFNPFGRQTMAAVLNNIIQYCNADKIELHIIYVVPVHRDLFDEHEQLCKVYEFLRTDKTAEILLYKTI